MEYYNNILCVTYEDLGAIKDYETIKKTIIRGRCTVVRSGYGRDTYALIQYSSLPDKWRAAFEAVVGDPAEVLRERERMKVVETMHRPEAVKWMSAYRYEHNGRRVSLPEGKQREYVMNYTALHSLLCEHERRVRLTKASNNTRRDLWSLLHNSSEQMRLTYPHKLPSNVARLRVKLMGFKVAMQEGEEVAMLYVVSGKMGNQNAQKITADGEALLIALRRQQVPRLSIEQIRIMYNANAEQMGWPQLQSESVLYKWYEKPSVKPRWFDAVYGESKAHQKYDRKHSTELPEWSCALWYGDGTKLNLYYKDDEGKIATINVYEVIDAASECLIGYHISESEDYDSQYKAFRMAIETAGVRPIEIVYDNQGGHKKLASQQFFSKIAMRHRPTAPYNGSSKTIEHAFYRLQSEVLSKHFNFTGQNITAKMDKSRPNIEFIEANKAHLPTLEELKAQYAACRREWNDMPHPKSGLSRQEMFDTRMHPSAAMVTEIDMVNMFWLTTSRPATYTNNGIRITVKGREYLYEVYESAGMPDVRWMSDHIDAKFYVQYDPSDMTTVRLLSAEQDADARRFVRVASTKMVIHRAGIDQSSEEKAFIRQMRDRVNEERMRRVTEGRLIEIDHGVAPEQHGLNSPNPKAMPKELLEQMDKRLGAARRRKVMSEGLGPSMKNISLSDWLYVDDTDEMTTQRVRSKY